MAMNRYEQSLEVNHYLVKPSDGRNSIEAVRGCRDN